MQLTEDGYTVPVSTKVRASGGWFYFLSGSLSVPYSGISYTFTPGLTEGTHIITARATDMAGNKSSMSSAAAITIDTTAPDPLL
jgi:hypothetical protein